MESGFELWTVWLQVHDLMYEANLPGSVTVNAVRHIASTRCLAHGHSKPGHIESGGARPCLSANSVWAAEPFAAVTEILQKLEEAEKEICGLIEFQSPRINQL